jgi:hypothetical protein
MTQRRLGRSIFSVNELKKRLLQSPKSLSSPITPARNPRQPHLPQRENASRNKHLGISLLFSVDFHFLFFSSTINRSLPIAFGHNSILKRTVTYRCSVKSRKAFTCVNHSLHNTFGMSSRRKTTSKKREAEKAAESEPHAKKARKDKEEIPAPSEPSSAPQEPNGLQEALAVSDKNVWAMLQKERYSFLSH